MQSLKKLKIQPNCLVLWTKQCSCLIKEKNMKVNPIRDRILIKPEDKDTVTSSGIVIPDSAAEKPLKGKVLAVGTGKIAEDGSIIPLVIKEGDTVLFGKTAGQTIKIEDVEHLILREEEIMAIVQ